MEYDAVVYDLDGTLVELDVDWGAARRDVAGALSARGVDTTDRSLWDLLLLGEEAGLRATVEERLTAHEREGARTATHLPLADVLPHDVPVGVCSLNSEAACRVALELHGIDDYVDALVGRDTLEVHKPDPGALLGTLDRLPVDGATSLFVGDSPRDRETADAAGVAYRDADAHADRLR
jgi:phosphoglycolate phosphatase